MSQNSSKLPELDKPNEAQFFYYIKPFLSLVVIGFIPMVALDILITEDHLIDYLVNFLQEDKIDEFIENNEQWKTGSYLFFLLFLVLKISIVASILWLILYLKRINFKFRDIFEITIYAQFSFIGRSYLLLMIVLFEGNEFRYEQLEGFSPLSILSLFDAKAISSHLIYPFQILNLFEVAYWFLLAYFLSKRINKGFNDSLGIVLSSYGIGLLLWILTIAFIIVSNT